MLLTIKESAALYVMDMVLSNLSRIEASCSTTGTIEAYQTSFLEDETKSGSKRNNEDIMTLIRY